MLETAVAKWPTENANFPHISGMTFFVNTLGEANSRVYNVKIMNSKTGKYESLELEKMYKIASSSFILLEGGDGMTMFEGAKVVSDTGILDIEVLENYIVNKLGRVISESYAKADTRITFTEGFLQHYPYVTDGDEALWIALVGVALSVIIVISVIAIRIQIDKRKYNKQ